MHSFLVVFDTNVIVSALLSKNENGNELKLMRYIDKKVIIPLYSAEIMKEYKEVLSRKEFGFTRNSVANAINVFQKKGIKVNPNKLDIDFKDEADLKFYEVVMEKREDNSYLVTGNKKHYPIRDFIVTPAEMMKMLDGER